MNWVLIEGDNGTGEDTLREFFEAIGWFHANNRDLKERVSPM